MLALTRSPVLWCIGSVLGWLSIPLMNANLDVIMRTTIPPEMQGRVFSCRNSLQFFTIPLGFLLGGWMIDDVFEPLMALNSPNGLAAQLFGTGKGSGAAAFLLVLGFTGVAVCIWYWMKLRKYTWRENDKQQKMTFEAGNGLE